MRTWPLRPCVLDQAVAALRREAIEANERRLLVLAGARPAGLDAAADVIDAGCFSRDRSVLVGPEAPPGTDGIPIERLPMDRTGDLLGTTREAVVFDAHDRLDPNALGRTVGVVDGGGLFVLLAPPLDEWPERRDEFDETLAVPPFDVDDVSRRVRRRFVETLRAHPGVAIVDVDAGRLARDGLTDLGPKRASSPVERPAGTAFPRAAYDACLTTDQVEALSALESLREDARAVVVESDRGRGKSSVAGLAAASLAVAGEDVVVTAPSFPAARAAFQRAEELVDALGERTGRAGRADADADADGDTDVDVDTDAGVENGPATAAKGFRTGEGGRLRFLPPAEAATADPDVLFVDEAAAFPVARLEAFLDAGRVAFTTTIHGYEGAGRGFSVRFRETLASCDLDVTEVTMAEPIRYAAGDPVEVWSFRALLLDAGPAVDQLVEGADPESVDYRALDRDALLDDEPLLREAFGLLVLAHYRTEPADLARLLDAPNVSVRALCHDGHVASIALLAREGALPADVRTHMYEGGRVRGNMLPDVLTSQLRDEEAGVPLGQRVMRIATHAAVRSRGLGSHLLASIRGEFADDVDWIGTGYGATPDLLDFWDRNGYSTVHLSTTRNAASGEHSAIMLAPTSDAGRDLHDRHAGRFASRIGPVLTDALSGLDPDVARAALDATDATAAGPAVSLDLDDAEWRLVAAAAYGPGLMDVNPGPFRRLALRHLLDPAEPDALTARQERLLVLKPLQGRGWGEVADALGFTSRRTCMRALGDAFRPLVDAYGTEAALDERDRYL